MSSNAQTTSGNKYEICHDCGQMIDLETMAAGKRLESCPRCGAALNRSQSTSWSTSPATPLSKLPPLLANGRWALPKGCSAVAHGQGLKLTASLRSIRTAIPAAAIALFWNGMVSIFAVAVLAGLYNIIVGDLPGWFTFLGVKDGKMIVNNHPMGISDVLFMGLFLTPFVAVGAGLAFVALMSLGGKVIVVIDDLGSYTSTGAGIFRLRKYFDMSQVTNVTTEKSVWHNKGPDRRKVIKIAADRSIKFGTHLNEEQLQWMLRVLRELLVNRSQTSGPAAPPYERWIAMQESSIG